jgi:hypothetical protein
VSTAALAGGGLQQLLQLQTTLREVRGGSIPRKRHGGVVLSIGCSGGSDFLEDSDMGERLWSLEWDKRLPRGWLGSWHFGEEEWGGI